MSSESLVGIGLGLDGPRRIAPIRTDTSMFAPGRNTLYTAKRRSSMKSEGREQKSKVYVNMDVVRDLYQKYDELIRFSAYAFSGWAISWVLFFVLLPFMVRYYGKIRGASLNYAFSWVLMIVIIIGLEYTVG